MSELKVKVLEAPIFAGVAQDLVLKSNNVNRIVIANTGTISFGATAGSESLRVTPVASSVNYLQVAGSATGNAVQVVAAGSDTNINLTLTPKGTGGVVFPAGAASTPSVTTTGDTNTGIWFPAADTIAASTAGTERMRINSSGNVGIGTTTPQAKLAVSNGGAAGLEFFVNYPGGGVGTYIQSYNRSSPGYVSTAYDAADHSFRISGTEKMFLNSSGNVGIGTSSPSGILDARGDVYSGNTSSGTTTFVRGASNWNYAGLNVIRNAANTSTPRSIAMPLDGDNLASTTIGEYNAIWGAYDSSPTTSSTSSALNGAMVYGAYAGHRWVTNGTERMRINSSGNVGIGTTAGTTTVSSGLAINNATAANYPGLEIQTAGVTRLYFNANNAESYITSVSTNPLVITTNGNERMRIDSSGNVGIGTVTTSNVRLTSIAATASWAGTFYANSGGASTTGLSVYGLSFGGNYSNGSAEVNIVYGSAGAGLDFSSYNGTTVTPRMRLNSSGNLLLGTTTNPLINAEGQINVVASTGDGFNIKHTVNGNNTFNIWQTGTTTFAALSFYKGATQVAVGSISCSTTGTSYNTTSDYRLKENVTPMIGALTTVALLKPCTYTWKADGSTGQGFIAHELQAVVPDCVTGTKDETYKDGKPQYQGVDTSFLVATLVAAIQELTARLEVLENK